jgi:Spy/CpxP family protein refolding chaperone
MATVRIIGLNRGSPIVKKENQMMNGIRLLAIWTAFAFAVPVIAFQAATAPTQQLPSVDQHLEMLSGKLGLTADQKERARPILKEMQDAMQKAMNDKNLIPAQMHEQMRLAQVKANRELREFLTDEQKEKLDELESDSHSGLEK